MNLLAIQSACADGPAVDVFFHPGRLFVYPAVVGAFPFAYVASSWLVDRLPRDGLLPLVDWLPPGDLSLPVFLLAGLS